ncbi:hypothetical protein H2O64_14035 [Kordia sp. YSTF-M3]|uniref:Uncharacterized protein n=1 Tax=Kordia aestuariivivens TaxID=2759037 RepID=A0ABR7QB33_9FLAO|nr:hypothetical protein [Kordia aestuariivivens]MBC8755792.1 hypothetical protein [Kordia aestuariivivens]
MKKKLTLLTLLMLIIFSCNTDENTSQRITPENNLKTYSDFTGYGLAHNLAMDHIATMPNFNNASLQDIFYFADTYSDSYFNNPSCNCDDWQTQQTHMTMIEGMLDDMNNASNTLVNMGFIDPEDIPLTDMLLTILDNAVSPENSTYKSVAEFTAEIEAFENFVINNYTVIHDLTTKTGNYAANILGACSIAKNSYSYWINATLDSSHPWNYRLIHMSYYNRGTNRIGPIQKGFFGDLWRGIKRGGADVFGFLVGGKCGGIVDGRDLGCAIKHAGKKSSGVR